MAFDLEKNKKIEYFITENSITTGPFEKSDILQKLNDNVLEANSQIYKDGKWVLLKNLPEFKQEFKEKDYKLLPVLLLVLVVLGVFITYKVYLNGIRETNTNKQSQLSSKKSASDTIDIREEKIKVSDSVAEQTEDTQQKEESAEVLIEDEEVEKSALEVVEKSNLNDKNKTTESIIKGPNNEIDKTNISINRKVDRYEKMSNESFLQEIYASNTKRNTSYKKRLSRLIKEVTENNLLDNNGMYSYICSSKDKLIEDAAYFNLIDALEFKNILSKKCP